MITKGKTYFNEAKKEQEYDQIDAESNEQTAKHSWNAEDLHTNPFILIQLYCNIIL